MWRARHNRALRSRHREARGGARTARIHGRRRFLATDHTRRRSECVEQSEVGVEVKPSRRSRLALLALFALFAALWITRGGSSSTAGSPTDPEASARGSSSGLVAGSSAGSAPELAFSPAPGALRLEGQVVDEEERPIAGATVAVG